MVNPIHGSNLLLYITNVSLVDNHFRKPSCEPTLCTISVHGESPDRVLYNAGLGRPVHADDEPMQATLDRDTPRSRNQDIGAL